MKRAQSWRGFVESDRLPSRLALLAALLTAPSLFAGLATEDYVFRAATRTPFSWSAVNLFGGPDVPGAVRAGQESGVLPWLASDALRLSFWRPLTSLTHQLDYRVLSGAVPLMHLESIALYGLLAFLSAKLLFRWVESRAVAGIAALLFAIDDAHGHAVGWLANRNAVLATVFGVAALLAHERWRRDGWKPGAWLSPALFGLGLLSGEMGLGALAYYLTRTLFLEPRGRRLGALLPVGLVTAAWALAYRELGHGTFGSGVYIDPSRSPGEYLRELPARLGAHLLGQLGAPPADAWTYLGDRAHFALALGGFAFLALAVIGAFPALAARGERGARVRFAVSGMLLALLPVCATFPSDRTLLFAGLGGCVLVAHVLEIGRENPALGRRALSWGFAALHVGLAPLLLPIRSLTMTAYHASVMRAASSAFAPITRSDERLVVVNAPDYYFCSLLRLMRLHAAGHPVPPSICLAGTRERVELRRVDEQAVSLRTPKGFLSEPFDRIYRSPSEPMPVGSSVFVGSAEASVDAVDARGVPTAATFRFIWPLDSPKLHFVEYRDGEYREISAPKPGEVRVVGP